MSISIPADTIDSAGTAVAARIEDPGPISSRSVQVTVRRRRVLASLLGAAVVSGLLSSVPPLGALIWVAAVAVAMAVAYLSVVAYITYARGRRELVTAFQRPQASDGWDWAELEREIFFAADASSVDAVPAAVSVGNMALARFVFSYALGWALTPVVVLIRLVRGDLSDLERSGVLGRIVSLQQHGRSQSIRLLIVGAAAVGVTTGGVAAASALVMPGVASAAPAGPSYVVRPGDTLGAIAARHGTTVPALVSLNRIADPNFIMPGEVIRLPGGASGGTSSSPAPTSATRGYTVQPGDTLGALATRFGTTVAALAAANHIANPNLIYVGQVLQIPGSGGASPSKHSSAAPSVTASHPSTYTVQPGDTLGALAARFATTVAALAAANHIANPNLIYVGQVLTIPAAGSYSPPPSGGSGGSRTPTPTTPLQGASGYINPFEYGSWSPSRIDEGVDWISNVTSPVVAIGDGVITYSSMSSGWPAGGFITYRLTSGSHAGDYIYIAEHITDLLPAGTAVSAGERIATALPGYPWTEWGWASGYGPEPAPSARYNGAPDGTPTPGGKAFARFLMELGVTGIASPGPGTDSP